MTKDTLEDPNRREGDSVDKTDVLHSDVRILVQGMTVREVIAREGCADIPDHFAPGVDLTDHSFEYADQLIWVLGQVQKSQTLVRLCIDALQIEARPGEEKDGETQTWVSLNFSPQRRKSSANATQADGSKSSQHSGTRVRELDCHYLDTIPLPTCYVSNSLEVIGLNERFATMFGRSVTEIVGRSIERLNTDLETHALWPPMSAIFEGETVEQKFCLKPPEGDLQVYAATHCPDVGEDGSVQGFFCLLNDQTEATHHTHLLNLIAGNLKGFIVLLDRENRIRFANRSFSESVGCSPQDICGRHLKTFVGDNAFEKTSRPRIEGALKGEPQTFENVLRMSDGTSKPLLVNLIPDVSADGEIQGVCALAIDITELNDVQDELDKLHSSFEISTKATGVGIVEFDADRPDWCFADHLEILLELEPGHLNSSRAEVKKRIHPDDLHVNDSARLEQEAKGEVKYEMRLRTSRGDYRWFSLAFHSLTSRGGEMTGWVGVITNIDALKKNQLAATAQVACRDEYLAMLSHELRNPLMAIRHAAEFLASTPRQHRQGLDYLGIINRQTRQMSKLLDDLLDVARVTQNRIELDNIAHDFRRTILETTETLSPMLETKRQRLKLDLTDDDLWVNGDPVRLKQMVTNLLTNASKYVEEQGEISVDCRRDSEHVVLTVQDDGRGIAAEKKENIFDLFFQDDSTLDREKGGMGVGLYLVKHIVDRHEGTIDVESEGLGKGSTFTVRLPVTSKRAVAEPCLPVQRSVRQRVCLVEDLDDARIALKMLLTRKGYEVFEFSDGESAAQKIPDLVPDIAIIDIGLPGKNGLEVAQELRANPRLDELVLIALTGYGQQRDREAIHQAGFNHHLVKPIGIAAICEVIDGTNIRRASA